MLSGPYIAAVPPPPDFSLIWHLIERPALAAATVGVLMQVDYYLTLWSSALYERHFSGFVKTEDFELNPMWQKAVRARRLFNPVSLFVTLLMTGAVFVLCRCDGAFPYEGRQFIVGFALGLYAAVNLNHVSNIMTYQYFRDHPGAAHGALGYRLNAALRMAEIRYEVLAGVLLLAAFLAPMIFTIAFALAPVFVSVRLKFLRFRAERRDPGGGRL